MIAVSKNVQMPEIVKECVTMSVGRNEVPSNYVEMLNKFTENLRELNASYTRNRILQEKIENLRKRVELIKNHSYINKNQAIYIEAKNILSIIDEVNPENKGSVVDKIAQGNIDIYKVFENVKGGYIWEVLEV